MGIRYYSFDAVPDITLAKYSVQEAGGLEDVIKAQTIFYRQLNRQGVLFNQRYFLIYDYNPDRLQGKRLKCYLGVDSEDGKENIDDFMRATPLSEYFKFYSHTEESGKKEPVLPKESDEQLRWAALVKQDMRRSSSLKGTSNDKGYSYYSVQKWKMNESARLMGLFRMMSSLNKRAIYAVMISPKEYNPAAQELLQHEIMKLKMILSTMDYSHKDSAAEKTMKEYEDMEEAFFSNPYFHCSIMAFSDIEDSAKLLLDAAASEAVEEGTYRILSGDKAVNPYEIIKRGGLSDRFACIPDTPQAMQGWNQTYILPEMAPFAIFPVLYPGETIEIPKESAPNHGDANEKNSIYLGQDTNDFPVYLPLKNFPKHTFVAGVPGSGKTNTMLHLVSQLSGSKAGHNIPVLILEPAKQEYRALVKNSSMEHFLVMSPGGEGPFLLRINPFEFPIGMQLSEYLNCLVSVFIGAFDLEPPMPFLIKKSLNEIYKKKGWYPFFINDGSREYPDMQMLYDQVGKLLDESDYAPDVKSNLKSVIQVRIGSLLDGEMGDTFNVSRSSVSPEEWMELSCVIELESMGKDAANFTTLLLVTIIRAMLKLHPKSDKNPRHIIFFEEAHNLIGPATESNGQTGNAKVASTKFIVDMLAEVRALKEAIIIADQLPTALAPQVTKNTSIKIGHRITATDDRELLANTMSADGVQMEQMGLYSPGQALCLYEGIQKPFEIKIGSYEKCDGGSYDSPNSVELFGYLKNRPRYRELMNEDFKIMNQKYRDRMDRVIWSHEEGLRVINDRIVTLFEKRGGYPLGSDSYKNVNYELISNAEALKKALVGLDDELTEIYLWYANYLSKNLHMFDDVYTDNECYAINEFQRASEVYGTKMNLLNSLWNNISKVLPDISNPIDEEKVHKYIDDSTERLGNILTLYLN